MNRQKKTHRGANKALHVSNECLDEKNSCVQNSLFKLQFKHTSEVTLPELYKPLFEPMRYKVYYGGRGAGKSWAFAQALVTLASSKKLRVLCTREYQASIKESVHKLLSDTIDRLKLRHLFDVNDNKIRCKNGSEFFFHGLHHDVDKIKSLENVDIAWVEEAQSVSKRSWEVLSPTIRAAGSEIWISFNPYLETDETFQRFIVKQNSNAVVVKVGWQDNPWFTDVLRQEMEHCRETDHDAYMHIWEGMCLKHSEAEVYKGKYSVLEFETPTTARFFQGADWGFSQDPLFFLRCFILPHPSGKGDDLYIDYEASQIKVEIDEMPKLFDIVPEAKKNQIKADSARPELISYMKNQGYKIEACTKWKGSIEDGIAYIRGFKNIYVHPRCPKVLQEFGLYKFKVDRITGEILTEVIDANNHGMDALRYALEPYIKGKKTMQFKRVSAQARSKRRRF